MGLVEQIPSEGLQFLHLIQDRVVGGTHTTPGIPEFSKIKTPRTALLTLDDWTSYEAVHINAARGSLQSAFKNSNLGTPVISTLWDRVLIMDFDIYQKDGTLRSPDEIPITPESIITRLKVEGRPLPFCYAYSGTPGNFHMIWVYDTPQVRSSTMLDSRGITAYWGADPKFTNSTIRNPIYRALHPNSAGQGTHWWTEWSDSVPTLHNKLDLAPQGVWANTSSKVGNSNKQSKKLDKEPTHRSPRGRFKARLSYPALVQLMMGAKDGDGRWCMLRSWIIRHINEHIASTGRCLSYLQLQEIIQEGNDLFGESVSSYRKKALAAYWTPKQQWAYVNRQKAAGENNWRAQFTHRVAIKKYFEIIDMKELLTKHKEDPQAHPLSDDLAQRANLYPDRKYHGSTPIASYVAWMIGYTGEYIDELTGELTVGPSPYRYVRDRLGNGRRLGYTRREYEEILALEATEASQGEEEIDTPAEAGSVEVQLTTPPLPSRLAESNTQLRATSPPKKERLYAC